MNEYNPDTVSPPYQTLIDLLEEGDQTPEWLAVVTGLDRRTIYELLLGGQPITEEIATELEHALGVPAKFWMERQRCYDKWKNEQ